jgi:hypothetical protein
MLRMLPGQFKSDAAFPSELNPSRKLFIVSILQRYEHTYRKVARSDKSAKTRILVVNGIIKSKTTSTKAECRS